MSSIQSRPLVVIGHSLGANEAVRVAANAEGLGGKVDLLVLFDPTENVVVPASVGTVISIYQRNGMGREAVIQAGYSGQVINIDLTNNPNVVHTNIEKVRELHELVVREVARLGYRAASVATPARLQRRQ